MVKIPNSLIKTTFRRLSLRWSLLVILLIYLIAYSLYYNAYRLAVPNFAGLITYGHPRRYFSNVVTKYLSVCWYLNDSIYYTKIFKFKFKGIITRHLLGVYLNADKYIFSIFLWTVYKIIFVVSTRDYGFYRSWAICHAHTSRWTTISDYIDSTSTCADQRTSCKSRGCERTPMY